MKLDDEKIFDPIRNGFVCRTPEEVVRQKLIFNMLKNLSFPKNLIAVEKDIFSLPHLKNKSIDTKRRADIIAFGKNDNGLFPLLLIECKAVKLNKNVIDQVIGYNYYVKAAFVSIANEYEIKTFFMTDKKIETIDFLPTYKDLMKAIK